MRLLGKESYSTPMGSIDNPVSPLAFALGCEATFVARAVDVDIHHLAHILERAAKHKGTAFVEVYQDCNVFNSGAFEYATDRATRPENVVYLEHGKPLLFGKYKKKGFRLNNMKPEVVELRKAIREDDLLYRDENAKNPAL